jgi:Flp pilus assembly protein TadG
MIMTAKLEPRGEPLTKTLGNVRTWRGILRSQSGQSLVELAFLTPVLLLLLIGTVEMGRYTSLSIMIGNSARAGAQYGAQNTTTAGDKGGIQSAALADLKDISGLKPAPQVTSTFVCGCDNGGTIIPTPETKDACKTTCDFSSHLVTSVQVTVSGTFKSMFNYPGIPTSLIITSTATERVGE